MEDTADIFDTSLCALFSVPPIAFSTSSADASYTYTPPAASSDPEPVELWLPHPPASVYTALQANNLWLAAVFLADQIAAGGIRLERAGGPSDTNGGRVAVCELGASAGLPGIIAARAGALVVGTDYDDPTIIKTMRRNYLKAFGAATEMAAAPSKDALDVTSDSASDGLQSSATPSRDTTAASGTERFWAVRGHTWGTSPAPLLSLSQGFDVLLLADTLWASHAHAELLTSIMALMKPGGIAHVAAGLHTGRWPVTKFLTLAREAGLDVRFGREVEWLPGGGWGERDAGGREEEGEVRGVVVYYTLHRN